MPESLPILSPAPGVPLDQPSIPSNLPLSAPPSPRRRPSVASRVRQLFRTPRNIFGLFRQYHSEQLPSHDPEEHIDLQDLFDDPETADDAPAELQDGNPFYIPIKTPSSLAIGTRITVFKSLAIALKSF